jgi:hypothetical protein
MNLDTALRRIQTFSLEKSFHGFLRFARSSSLFQLCVCLTSFVIEVVF